jgi:4-amino-4-deoxy-L-arabinose transferase-like glycosyltransferase
MNLMNIVRSIISVFVIALAAVAIAGWLWAGGQPSPKMEGARVALGLCGLSSVVCLWLLWKEKPAASINTQ